MTSKGRKGKDMPKILLMFISLLKSAFFRNKNQYNVKSKDFDMLKVVMFLYVCVSSTFTVYSVQYIYEQKAEIDKLTLANETNASRADCISEQLTDYLDLRVLTKSDDIKIITMIKKCLKEKKEKPE